MLRTPAILNKYEYSRAAFASLRPHTCCLRNRFQALSRASRATSLESVFEELIFILTALISKDIIKLFSKGSKDITKSLLEPHDLLHVFFIFICYPASLFHLSFPYLPFSLLNIINAH